MTTSAESDLNVEIRYEGPAVGFGGYDAADFFIYRPHQHSLECALQLAMDARRLLEEQTGPLSEGAVQALLKALAQRFYRERIALKQEIPAIHTIRAREIEAGSIDAILHEAGLR